MYCTFFCVCMIFFLLSILVLICCCFFFFFKQKTAYEMRISDWSSDVCSSDLIGRSNGTDVERARAATGIARLHRGLAVVHRNQRAQPRQPGQASRAGYGFVGSLHPRRRQGLFRQAHEIGRESIRERVCQYVSVSVVAEYVKKKKTKKTK